MKTSILGLRTTIYQVGDIAAAKAWYSDIFQSAPYFDEPFYVGFNIGGYELGLQPEEAPTTDKKASVLTYWGVEDIAAEFDRFISLGAVADEAPNNVGGEILVATVKDPWGNLIGLIYNPDFKLHA
jgi:predicted enzyme related to lactoylglutathione lyase